MKGTVFSVALNHRSQLDAWDQAFHQPPYQTPPKTPVWFIKPRNTHLANGGAIPFPAGETVQSGGTLAVIIGDTARKVPVEQVSRYLAGYALANDVSLPESSFYRPAIKAKCRDGFCPLGRSASWRPPIGWRSSPRSTAWSRIAGPPPIWCARCRS